MTYRRRVVAILAKRAAVTGGLATALFATVTAFATQRPPQPMPTSQTAAHGCRWVWRQGDDIGLWSQACDLKSGRWRVEWRHKSRSFELLRNGRRVETVVRLWPIDEDQGLVELARRLKTAGLVPDDEKNCQFVPQAVRPDVRTRAQFVIKPLAMDVPAVTESGEVPEPPCGELGASTHGIRYFVTDLRFPGRVVYVNEGQDGLLFDPSSITLSDDR